jgi:hypothetical protein
MLAVILKEILGLFVDDQGLALAIISVLALALLLAFALQAPSGLAGAVLIVGCLGALAYSALSGRAR